MRRLANDRDRSCDRCVRRSFDKNGRKQDSGILCNSISHLLVKPLKEGNKAEATKIIREEAIQAPVAELVGQVLSASHVVPIIPMKGATADDVLTMFTQVIEIGLDISKSSKADIYLPGSFLGTDTVSCFATGGAPMKIAIKDRTMIFSFEPMSGFAILPAKNPMIFCNEMKERARVARELSKENYISFRDLFRSGVLVSEVNTRILQFRNWKDMEKSFVSAMGVSNGRVSLNDERYEKGIQMMLEYNNEWTNLDLLPPETIGRIGRLRALIDRFKKNPKKE
jgi:hypothetical protein